MVSPSKNRCRSSSVSGAEVGGEEAVEVPRRLLARAGRDGHAHGVVDDVVGVHSHRAVHVTGALGLQVLLDDGDQLALLH
jgi:hypothetical protein